MEERVQEIITLARNLFLVQTGIRIEAPVTPLYSSVQWFATPTHRRISEAGAEDPINQDSQFYAGYDTEEDVMYLFVYRAKRVYNDKDIPTTVTLLFSLLKVFHRALLHKQWQPFVEDAKAYVNALPHIESGLDQFAIDTLVEHWQNIKKLLRLGRAFFFFDSPSGILEWYKGESRQDDIRRIKLGHVILPLPGGEYANDGEVRSG